MTLVELNGKRLLFINPFKIVCLRFLCLLKALENPLTDFCYSMFCFLECTWDVHTVFSVDDSYLSVQHKASSYLIFMSTLWPILKGKQDSSSCHLFGGSRQMFCLSGLQRQTETRVVRRRLGGDWVKHCEILRRKIKCILAKYISLLQNVHFICFPIPFLRIFC